MHRRWYTVNINGCCHVAAAADEDDAVVTKCSPVRSDKKEKQCCIVNAYTRCVHRIVSLRTGKISCSVDRFDRWYVVGTIMVSEDVECLMVAVDDVRRNYSALGDANYECRRAEMSVGVCF